MSISQELSIGPTYDVKFGGWSNYSQVAGPTTLTFPGGAEETYTWATYDGVVAMLRVNPTTVRSAAREARRGGETPARARAERARASHLARARARARAPRS